MKIVTPFRWYTLILRKPLTNWRTDKDREDDQESIKNLFTQFEYFMKLKWLFNEFKYRTSSPEQKTAGFCPGLFTRPLNSLNSHCGFFSDSWQMWWACLKASTGKGFSQWFFPGWHSDQKVWNDALVSMIPRFTLRNRTDKKLKQN